MKIVLCTVPIRPAPTDFPPFGLMAVFRSLESAGYSPVFFDIDGLRPSWQDISRFFARERPDVIGISAVVSTSYGYVKRLCALLKETLPGVRIVLGGNLAASAEILHRRAGVDFCVIGEGERVAPNLLRALERSGDLEAVRGLTFLRPDGELVFTGYEDPLPASEVFQPDFTILERFSKMSNFFRDPLERSDFAQDERTYQPHRRGKKLANLMTAKGCVNRCTFCHRWDKGYRAVPAEQVLEQARLLKEKYEVGFISFSDENFGSDKRQVRELLRGLAPLDLLWEVGGVRVRSVDPDLLREMRAAGCVAVYYGMETGSPAILEVMEKHASLQDNIQAARWTREAGLFTIFQIVLGMPGECPQTIRETAEFLKAVTEDTPVVPRSLMSINYVQALPGTPVYEYARLKGLLGEGMDAEERYLLAISDVDAADDAKFINFTEYPLLTVRSWRKKIVLEVMHHYHQRRRTPVPSPLALLGARTRKPAAPTPGDHHDIHRLRVQQEYMQTGYFNIPRDFAYDVTLAYFFPLSGIIVALGVLKIEFNREPLSKACFRLWEWVSAWLRPRPAAAPVGALRKALKELAGPTGDPMSPLRAGR